MSNESGNHEHGVRGYIIVALILAVITYLEYYIVEFPVAWLGTGGTMFWVIAMSIAKFLMVIAYFMHLKDDDATYTGFFSSGMVIGLGTFVAFTFLMTLPGSLQFVRAEVTQTEAHAEDPHGYGDEGHLDEAVLENIETNGYNRSTSAILMDPPPKNQTLVVTPPNAASEGWSVALATPSFAAASAEAAPAVADDTTTTAPEPAAPVVSEPEPSEPVAQAVTFDAAAAETAYNANCASCHQASGAGLPGAFPPLANHMPDFASDEGRDYVINAIVYGLQGQIVVNGTPYNGVMPAWGYLADDVIAGALNHAYTAWGNADALPDDFAYITPDEVAARKGKGLTAPDVLNQRNTLTLP